MMPGCACWKSLPKILHMSAGHRHRSKYPVCRKMAGERIIQNVGPMLRPEPYEPTEFWGVDGESLGDLQEKRKKHDGCF